jgi:acyl-coenzyme A thioesterase PaaI-like protein
MKWALNLYPPYLFTGIRVTHIDPFWRELRVEMALRFYNRNAVGTHFGGSLYAMVDPHPMLLLMRLLGPDYIVWDKAATIDFRRPGRGRVHACIRVEEERVEEIRRRTAGGDAFRPVFEIPILDEEGEVVAQVEKVIHVRRKEGRTG